MKASALDRRVDKEARLLIRAARGLAGGKREAELKAAVRAVEAALTQDDRLALRAALPALDAAVDAAAADDNKSTAREYIESIGVAVVIALLLRAFVVEAFKIPSSSMIPSLEIGDHIFVNKLVYGPRIPYTQRRLFTLRGPARGEIVVFNYPCEPEKDFIKRVVAVAGDTVEVRCGILRVNGTPVAQTLVPGPCSYDDQDEVTGAWSKAACSRYHEQHGGFGYDVLMHEGRPGKEARRAADGSGGYVVWSDQGDFPKLIADGVRDEHGQPLLIDPEPPHCDKMRSGAGVAGPHRRRWRPAGRRVRPAGSLRGAGRARVCHGRQPGQQPRTRASGARCRSPTSRARPCSCGGRAARAGCSVAGSAPGAWATSCTTSPDRAKPTRVAEGCPRRNTLARPDEVRSQRGAHQARSSSSAGLPRGV